MNWQCICISLIFLIFVKLNLSEARKIRFKKIDFLQDNDRDYKHKSDPPRYYNLFNRLFRKNELSKLFKRYKHGANKQPFDDLTRDELQRVDRKANEFSDDYIDVSELARLDIPDVKPHYIEPQEKRISIDIEGNPQEVLKILHKIARRTVPQPKSISDSSDSETSSSESSDEISDDSKKPLEIKKPARHGPKRFQIINNNSGERRSDSDDDKDVNFSLEASTDLDDDERNEDKSEESDIDGYHDKYVYIQSPTRHFKAGRDRRRRLQHFLPKRVHWDERDFLDLRNYWIDGPKGRYPAPYKTPY